MDDPWKYLAFLVSGMTGLWTSNVMPLDSVSESLGIQEVYVPFIVAAGSGLIVGFIVDEMLPVYLEQVRSRGGGGGSSMGGSSDDFDMDSDMDI